MNIRRQAHTDQASALTTGWLLSCVLHGTLALAALLFVQRLQLAPQSTSFQWDVAMVGTMASSTIAPSPKSSTSSAPPVQEAMPAQVVTRARNAQPSSVNTPLTAEPTYDASQVPSSPPQADQVIQQQAIASTPYDSAMTSSSVPHSQMETETSPESAPRSEPLESIQSGAALSEIHSTLTRAELTDLLIKWSENLEKHYPALPRTEGIQGKVTVVAMLHNNGVLSDIRVAKSSGNALLDQAAVEDVKNGPPIKLSSPLGRPSMLVKLPIVYVLSDRR